MHRLAKLPALSQAHLFGLEKSDFRSKSENEDSFVSVPQSTQTEDLDSAGVAEDVDLDEDDLENPLDIPQRQNVRITLSQLYGLFKEYELYNRIKSEDPGKYKTGASIRSIVSKVRFAKSTVHFYFNKFRTNPDYIHSKFLSCKNYVMQNARKGIPKYYPSSLEQGLIDWIFRNRQEGLTLTGSDIIDKAKEMINCPKVMFSRKWLRSFLKRNNLSFRKCTHFEKAQQFPSAIEKRISQFHTVIEVFREKFSYDNALVINMDETPVYFDYNVTTTEEKGAKLVTRLQIGDEKRRVTCVLTVSGEGNVLRPMIIYNQKEILNLEPEDFQTYPLFCWSQNG